MNECIICYSKIKTTTKTTNIVCKNGCNIYYHTDCFLKTGNNCCPLCRSEIESDNKENIDKIKYNYRLKYLINELKYNNPLLSQLTKLNTKNLLTILNINSKDKN